MILTNERLYTAHFSPLDLSCPVLLQERCAAGGSAEALVPPGVERIVAVGGGPVLDLAQRLAQHRELLQTRSFADFAVTSLDVLRSCLGLEPHEHTS